MPPPPEARRPGALPLRVGLILAAVVLAAGCSGGSPSPSVARPIGSALDDAGRAEGPFPGLTEVELAVGDDCLRLVVTDSVDERSQGMRGRDSLGSYDGMLFVFDETSQSSFTMQGVPVPLDIAWYTASGRPVDREDMVPCPASRTDCPPYSSRGAYRFALETLDGGLPSGALGGCPS